MKFENKCNDSDVINMLKQFNILILDIYYWGCSICVVIKMILVVVAS